MELQHLPTSIDSKVKLRKIIMVTGKKASGKTTATFKLLAERYINLLNQKVLFYDPNDEYRALSLYLLTNIYQVPHDGITSFMQSNINIGCITPSKMQDYELALRVIHEFKNGCLVFDDFFTFFEIWDALLNNTDCDRIIHNQSPRYWTLSILRKVDTLRLFQTYNENWNGIELGEYSEILNVAKSIVEHYKQLNRFFYVDVDMKNMKISGDFSWDAFNKASKHTPALTASIASFAEVCP